jgi:signal transduction histidine kinase
MARKDETNREMYLDRSSEYTLTAIEEIRKLTKGLTADAIKNFGLYEAIRNICKDTMEVNPIKISYRLDLLIENKVNDKFKLNVYRIMQEQLNNILKHAGATLVNIRVSQNKKWIIISITDNGVGFDTEKKQEGIGIANIKSRSKSYNGTVDLVSKPGRGCILKVSFPVNDPLLSPES